MLFRSILCQLSLNGLPFIFSPPLLYKPPSPSFQDTKKPPSLLFSRSEERRVGKEIILSCKIHMVEEGTLNGGPKGREKEALGEEE